MNQKEEIKKQLIKANLAYYNSGAPIMSDIEYDNLLEKYLSLSKDNLDIGATPNGEKVEHEFKLYSLQKVTTDYEIERFVEKALEINKYAEFIVMDKFDGLTISGIFNKQLTSLATRGNGIIGQNIASKKDCIVNLPNNIKYENKINIFGEAVMLKDTMKTLNQNGYNFKNARNAAAGTLNLLDDTEAMNRGLSSFIYGVNPYNLFPSYNKALEFLEDQGFCTPDYKIAKNASEIKDAISAIQSSKGSYNYDIDGVVISINQSSIRDSLGYRERSPKWAIAFKFPQEGVWTELQAITLQTGKTGRITPVAELAPVEIMGSTVSRATLHNMGIVKALGLNKFGSRAEVKVIKANDIIPRIVDVRYDNPNDLQEEDICISICPACGGKVELINDQHFCTNIESCEAQLLGRIVSLGKRDALDIVGLSEATAQKMIDYYKKYKKEIITELDFTLPLHFSLEDIEELPGFAEKSAENLYKEIQKAKVNTTIDRFIYACSIPLIGRSASKAISKEFDSVEGLAYEIVYNGCNHISNLEGFGPNMIKSLKEHSGLLSDLWDAGVKPVMLEKKEVKKVEKQLTFVITGKFQDGDRLVKRDEIKIWIEEKGHKVAGSVSAKTNYLLIEDLDSTTSKAVKARELGIPLINSLDKLKEIIN